MRIIKIAIFTFFFTLTSGLVVIAGSCNRIYGQVTTVDGDVYKGMIRWDRNEGNWFDVLDGDKELPDKDNHRSSRQKYSERKTTIEIFGIKFHPHKTNWSWSSNIAQSGIRFGHLKSLEVIDDNSAMLTLKSGEKVKLSNGSTDIGTDIREIIIEDPNKGETDLEWDDLDRVDFLPCRTDMESDFGERLYGTLTTRRGEEFTGYICWDMDEIFTNDILDGDSKGRRRKIKFGKLESIERYSSSGATVTLMNGDETLLRGTNDVNDGNRGIIVSDPGFGQVIVEWDEFDKLDFKQPPQNILNYDDFDGGRPLTGTVYTEDGDSYTGKIRWDDDEEYTWEILDGKYHDIDFDIEFGLIKKIDKKSYRSAIVTVWDGRTFRLRDSNDVNEENKGIYIEIDNGEEVEVDWEDFSRLDLTKK